MKLTRKKVLFVSTVIGTRWQVYSQALIRHASFDAEFCLIDGTCDWHPLNFLDKAFDFQSDYIVHIDEDCFLVDPAGLSELIEKLESLDGHIMAGTPDGGVPWRVHNPVACNLFMTVFKTKPLRALLEESEPNWRKMTFEPRWMQATEADWRSPQSGQNPFQFDECEPYYPLFWLILSSGWRILYLKVEYNLDRRSSDVLAIESSRPIAFHMWHLRYWCHSQVDPNIGLSNLVRYERAKVFMDSIIAVDFMLRMRLYREYGRLLWQRGLRRLSRSFLFSKRESLH